MIDDNDDKITINAGQILSRRNVMLGGVSLVAVSQSGCIHLLLRLVLGRAAVGVLARAVGGRGAAAMFGRGVAVGSSVARTTALRTAATRPTAGRLVVPESRILRKDGKEVARTVEDQHGTFTTMNGARVLYSERRGRTHFHQPAQGRSLGSSKDKGEFVEHRDNRGFVQAYDRIRMARRVIEHFDKDEKIVGQTPLRTHDNTVFMDLDEDGAKAFDALYKANGLDCPEALRARLDMQNYNDQCGSKCGQSSMRLHKYIEEQKRCAIKRQ